MAKLFSRDDLALATAEPRFPARPHSSSLPSLLRHAKHELAAGAGDAEVAFGSVLIGLEAAGLHGVSVTSAALCAVSALSAAQQLAARVNPGLTRGTSAAGVGALSAGRQLTPEWPCLAAATWHSRLQNHTTRHRPQRRSLHPLLPQAWHEVAAGAIGAATEWRSQFSETQILTIYKRNYLGVYEGILFSL